MTMISLTILIYVATEVQQLKALNQKVTQLERANRELKEAMKNKVKEKERELSKLEALLERIKDQLDWLNEDARKMSK